MYHMYDTPKAPEFGMVFHDLARILASINLRESGGKPNLYLSMSVKLWAGNGKNKYSPRPRRLQLRGACGNGGAGGEDIVHQ